VVRLLLAPILFVTQWIFFLATRLLSGLIGILLSVYVGWIRWRHGPEVADEVKRSLEEAESAGVAWRQRRQPK
jgi:hypothetical protein